MKFRNTPHLAWKCVPFLLSLQQGTDKRLCFCFTLAGKEHIFQALEAGSD